MANIVLNEAIVVEGPQDKVFDFVSAPVKFPMWRTGVTNAQVAEDFNGNPGSRYSYDYLWNGRIHLITHEIAVNDPPNSFSFRAVSGPYPIDVDYMFDTVDVDNTTVVHCHQVIRSDSKVTEIMFIVLGPLLKRLAGNLLRNDLKLLVQAYKVDTLVSA